MGNATTKVIRKRPAELLTSCQFEGYHYPVHIPKCSGSKIGSKKCPACNFGKKELKTTSHTSSLKCKLTSYQCDVCKVPLCIELCFKTYHKLANNKATMSGDLCSYSKIPVSSTDTSCCTCAGHAAD